MKKKVSKKVQELSTEFMKISMRQGLLLSVIATLLFNILCAVTVYTNTRQLQV